MPQAGNQLMFVDDIRHHGVKSNQGLHHPKPLHELDDNQRHQQLVCAVFREPTQKPQHNGYHLTQSPAQGSDDDRRFLVEPAGKRTGKSGSQQSAHRSRRKKVQIALALQLPKIGIHVQVQRVVDSDHGKDDQHA